LGLAISRHLIELMGGRLEVESELGVGSTFHFSLNLPLVAADRAANLDDALPPSDAGARFDARVLLVEDNAVNRRMARILLEQLGCRVDEAADGREAVERAATGQHDLVLMDVSMPEMDGFEATLEIRRREGDRHRAPIIAMTALAMRGDRERCLAAGMDDHLPKPVKRQTLAAMLGRFLPPAATDCAAAAPDSTPAADRATAIPVLDTSLLASAIGGDRAAAEELVTMTVEDARQRFAELAAAIGGGDAKMAATVAHSLAGIALAIGGMELGHLAKRIEAGASAEHPDACRAILAELDIALNRLEQALRQTDWSA
jgi:CheY-like chemotaxis protein